MAALALTASGLRIGTARGEEQPTPTATGTPTATPTGTASAKDEADAKMGKTVSSDYVAKHFSLVTGAVVLNPFKFTKQQVIPPGSSMPVPVTVLETGTTEANAFIEGGVRYRWAWLSRIAPAREAADELAAVETKITDTKKALKKAKKRLPDLRRETSTAQDTVEQISELETQLTDLKREQEQKGLALDRKRAAWEAASESPVTWIGTRLADGEYSALAPTDWVVRMGFAFPGGSDTTSSSIVGGSDFYGEATMGLNLLRFTLPTERAEDTPLRGSFNLEAAFGSE